MGSLKEPAAPRLRPTGPKEFVAASKMHHIRSLLINRSIFVKPFKRLKTTTGSRILFFFVLFVLSRSGFLNLKNWIFTIIRRGETNADNLINKLVLIKVSRSNNIMELEVLISE